jgi:hypothetical protein
VNIKHVMFFVLIFPFFWAVSPASGTPFTLSAETGAMWFSRNDVRIPGDEGTRFDLLDLTGSGAEPFIRLYARYEFTNRHLLRFTFAPVRVSGTGTLDENVFFDGSTFESGVPTKGIYQFNTYRLTYRWMYHRGVKWHWGIGGALLVRDAKVELQQGLLKESNTDLGFVPLLHVYGAYYFNDRVSAIMDIEGAGASQGRAIDAAVKIAYQWPSGWHAAAGYRTLEGGADNNSVYTFAWLHFLNFEIGYNF